MLTQTQQSSAPLQKSQAARLIEVFGGARKLSRALFFVGHYRDPAAIYRWTYPKNRHGSGGMVPLEAWPGILEAARFHNVQLPAELFDLRNFL